LAEEAERDGGEIETSNKRTPFSLPIREIMKGRGIKCLPYTYTKSSFEHSHGLNSWFRWKKEIGFRYQMSVQGNIAAVIRKPCNAVLQWTSHFENSLHATCQMIYILDRQSVLARELLVVKKLIGPTNRACHNVTKETIMW